MLSVFLETPNELRAAAAEHFACVAIRIRLVRGIWRPSTKRGLLARLVIGLYLTLALIIFLSLAAFRSGIPPPIMEIAYYLLPGHSLPTAASCDIGDSGFRYLSFCTAFQEGAGLVHFTYDRRTQVIRSASIAVDAFTIGDLIMARGNPTGYRRKYGTIQIYWGEKSALVSVPLNSASQVRLLLYYLDASDLPQDRVEWRGFLTVDSLSS